MAGNKPTHGAPGADGIKRAAAMQRMFELAEWQWNWSHKHFSIGHFRPGEIASVRSCGLKKPVAVTNDLEDAMKLESHNCKVYLNYWGPSTIRRFFSHLTYNERIQRHDRVTLFLDGNYSYESLPIVAAEISEVCREEKIVIRAALLSALSGGKRYPNENHGAEKEALSTAAECLRLKMDDFLLPGRTCYGSHHITYAVAKRVGL